MEHDREVLRALDRRKRQRRMAKMETMRATVATLERALPIMLTLDTQDVQWHGFLDEQAVRIRHLMLQSLQLTKEAQQLQATQTQLQQLLHEHRIASRVLAGILGTCVPLDHDFVRWQRLTRQYFNPWCLEECQEEMDAALKEIMRFQWSTDLQTSGCSFLGWRDIQRIDRVRGAFQCEFQKTFRGYDMIKYVNVGWAAYTDTTTYFDIMIGPRAKMSGEHVAVGRNVCAYHEVLQELTSNLVIVRNIERYPDVAVDAHLVYLVFRIEIERGYIMGVRSICCPELIRAIDGPNDVWPSNSTWMHWEQMDGDESTFTLRIGGSLRGSDINYANQWMVEALGCVLRSERLATGRQLITFDAPQEQSASS